MSKPISKTYMQVDYPRGATTIGCVFETNAGQRINMLGAVFSVRDLLESGYTFSPLVAMTPEVVEALREVIFETQLSVDAQWTNPCILPSLNTLRQLLAQVAQEDTDR